MQDTLAQRADIPTGTKLSCYEILTNIHKSAVASREAESKQRTAKPREGCARLDGVC